MRIIALVTQKGGSGKSTLAACLAVAAMEAREKVFLVDMDPQQSLLKWGAMRNDKDIPVETITAAKLPRALAALEQSGIDLVLLDTPGTDSAATEAAMKAADLCVIPARPTMFDIWSSEVTRTKLKTLGKDYRVRAQPMSGVAGQPARPGRRQGARGHGWAVDAADRLARRLSGGRARRHGRDRAQSERQGRRRNAPSVVFAQASPRQGEDQRESRSRRRSLRLSIVAGPDQADDARATSGPSTADVHECVASAAGPVSQPTTCVITCPPRSISSFQ